MRPQAAGGPYSIAVVGSATPWLVRRFSPPRLLVAAARLLRVYALLRDPGRQIKEVAAKAGYHSQYQLTQHMRALTGHTPRTVRTHIEPEQFVTLLVEGVRRPIKARRAYGRSRS